jgi:hypothetical protein
MVWFVPVGLVAWALFEILVDRPVAVEWFLTGSFAIQIVEGMLLVLIGALVLRRRPGLFLGWLSYAAGLYVLVLLALRTAAWHERAVGWAAEWVSWIALWPVQFSLLLGTVTVLPMVVPRGRLPWDFGIPTASIAIISTLAMALSRKIGNSAGLLDWTCRQELSWRSSIS